MMVFGVEGGAGRVDSEGPDADGGLVPEPGAASHAVVVQPCPASLGRDGDGVPVSRALLWVLIGPTAGRIGRVPCVPSSAPADPRCIRSIQW